MSLVAVMAFIISVVPTTVTAFVSSTQSSLPFPVSEMGAGTDIHPTVRPSGVATEAWTSKYTGGWAEWTGQLTYTRSMVDQGPPSSTSTVQITSTVHVTARDNEHEVRSTGSDKKSAWTEHHSTWTPTGLTGGWDEWTHQPSYSHSMTDQRRPSSTSTIHTTLTVHVNARDNEYEARSSGTSMTSYSIEEVGTWRPEYTAQADEHKSIAINMGVKSFWMDAHSTDVNSGIFHGTKSWTKDSQSISDASRASVTMAAREEEAVTCDFFRGGGICRTLPITLREVDVMTKADTKTHHVSALSPANSERGIPRAASTSPAWTPSAHDGSPSRSGPGHLRPATSPVVTIPPTTLVTMTVTCSGMTLVPNLFRDGANKVCQKSWS